MRGPVLYPAHPLFLQDECPYRHQSTSADARIEATGVDEINK